MLENYLVKRNDEVGRYAIAARYLRAGEEVLTETPFAVGPNSYTPPVCLTCCNPNPTALCQKCRWPVCDESCSVSDLHAGECLVFSQAKTAYRTVPDCEDEGTSCSPQYECITPLRVLLNIEKDRKRWETEISLMESHVSLKRTLKPLHWAAQQNNIVNFIRHRLKLKERFDEDLIEKVCGILEVNCFEMWLGSGMGRGLYPQTAILSHSCIANTIHTIIPEDNYRLSLRTTMDLEEGQELFSSYVGSLQPTLFRRGSLYRTKYFWCGCKRCRDPTEMSTNMSTLLCPHHSSEPAPSLVSTNPLDKDADWVCEDCHWRMSSDSVVSIIENISEEIRKEVDSLPFGPEKLIQAEKMLEKYKGVLHTSHALNVGLWHSAIELYGRVDGYKLDQTSPDVVRRKLELTAALLSILDVVEPGYTRIRGWALYEYQTVALRIPDERGKAEKALEECAKILELEPALSPEARQGERARSLLATLRQLNSQSSTPSSTQHTNKEL